MRSWMFMAAVAPQMLHEVSGLSHAAVDRNPQFLLAFLERWIKERLYERNLLLVETVDTDRKLQVVTRVVLLGLCCCWMCFLTWCKVNVDGNREKSNCFSTAAIFSINTNVRKNLRFLNSLEKQAIKIILRKKIESNKTRKCEELYT